LSCSLNTFLSYHKYQQINAKRFFVFVYAVSKLQNQSRIIELLNKLGSITFWVGKMERVYILRGLVRRTLRISIGQRPMNAGRYISARLKALKPLSVMLTPFQGLLIIRFHFIGRCPMLLMQGLRPYLLLPTQNIIEP
jgi:hypothetical protein